MIRFLVIDALNLIRRVHAATPETEGEEGSRSALEATSRSLRRALKEAAPTHTVAVFDGEGPTWRHRLYPEYKADRKPMPESLRAELPRYREAFLELGVTSVDKPELEADDVAATLASKVAASGGVAIVLSTDALFLQLLAEGVVQRDHFQRRELDRAYVEEKFGVSPEQLVDLWALAGNPTTHIPGVPRVGLKTAAKLLAEHGDLERVLSAASGLPGKLGESLRESSEVARLSRRLAKLPTDLELGWNLRDFQRRAPQGRGDPRSP